MKKYFVIVQVLAIILCSFACSKRSDKIPPLVQNGAIDLSSWDFNKDGIVKLRGEWKFFPNKLLTPDTINLQSDMIQKYMNVPSSWNDSYESPDKKLGHGYGSYYLEMKGLDSEKMILALRVNRIYISYNIWINGAIKLESGVTGADKKNTIAEYNNPEEIYFSPVNGTNSIIIQVSNFQHRAGGIWSDVELGTSDQMHSRRDLQIFPELFLMGSFIMMGIYHIFLFLYRRKNISALHLGIFCFFCSLRLFIMGETLFVVMFPHAQWEIQQKIEYLSYVLAVPFISLFVYHIFPGLMRKIVLYFTYFMTFTFSMCILFTTTQFYSLLNTYFQFFMLLLGFYFIFVFMLGLFKRMEGALFETLGMIILIFCILMDVLYYNEIISFGSGNMYAVGLFSFIAFQTIILSRILSSAYTKMEVLADQNGMMFDNLKDLNDNLEQKIDERTQELNIAVEYMQKEISEREKIEEELRHYASTDILTGILNRAAGMQFLEKNLNFAIREKKKITVCFIDVNGLKQINDSLGHKEGDDLIMTTAEVISRSLRGSDTLCRMGGDEFLIIFPNSSIDNAIDSMKRVIVNINKYNEKGEKPFKISISYGFSEYTGDGKETPDSIVEKADNMMYRFKKALKKKEAAEKAASNQ